MITREPDDNLSHFHGMYSLLQLVLKQFIYDMSEQHWTSYYLCVNALNCHVIWNWDTASCELTTLQADTWSKNWKIITGFHLAYLKVCNIRFSILIVWVLWTTQHSVLYNTYLLHCWLFYLCHISQESNFIQVDMSLRLLKAGKHVLQGDDY